MRIYGNVSAPVVGHHTDPDDEFAGLRTKPWGRSVTDHVERAAKRRSPIQLQPLAPSQERALIARTEPALPKPKRPSAKGGRPVSPRRAVILERHAAGDDVPAIAADLGITTGAVHYHLRQAGAAPTRRSRTEHVDTAAILDRYRAGDTIPAIATELGYGVATVRRRVTAAAADGLVQLRDDRARKSGGRNARTFTPQQLADAATAYLDGATLTDVARQLGTGPRQARDALVGIGIRIRPPANDTTTRGAA